MINAKLDTAWYKVFVCRVFIHMSPSMGAHWDLCAKWMAESPEVASIEVVDSAQNSICHIVTLHPMRFRVNEKEHKVHIFFKYM